MATCPYAKEIQNKTNAALQFKLIKHRASSKQLRKCTTPNIAKINTDSANELSTQPPLTGNDL